MFDMNHLYLNLLGPATWQTIYMVFISGFFSIFLGLILGVILHLTKPSSFIHKLLGLFINITRSIPYIIFMIALIPFTRLLVGTSIGINAAIVPLTLAAIPFYARIAESAIAGVAPGLVEAAVSLGASPWQIIRKVWLPEAASQLIKGATLTLISLIGYSAMAGAVGGGGLGELAIEYGYQRFDWAVMLETVIILIILVQLVQLLGDYLSKTPVRKNKLNLLWALCVIFWIASLGFIFYQNRAQPDSLKIGIVSGPMEQVIQVAQEVAKKQYGLDIQPIIFSDYVLPNTALNNGNIDANIFQHIPYLNTQVTARAYKLTWIAKTFVYPMGVYSQKIKNISQLKDHSIIAIPNDPSNEGRALLLFQKEALIKLKPGAGLLATPNDIIFNPRGLIFKTLDGSEIPRSLPDVDLAAINNDYIQAAGFTLKQALFHEGPDAPYANIIVVQTSEKDRPVFQKLIQVMHSQAVINITQKEFANTAIPAW